MTPEPENETTEGADGRLLHAETDLYRHVREYVRDTPWAMLPAAFARMREIVVMRLSGARFDDEELQARLEAARSRTRRTSGAGGVAVIPIHGVIVPRATLFTEFSGGTSMTGLQQMLSQAMADEDVGSILLDVDSPGGSVELVPETAAMIREARKRKPIVAIANTDAASAAYHLASQASEIVVTPSGLVGSIGVFAAHQDFSKQLEQEGVSVTLVHAGKFKVEGNPFEPLSDEARGSLQALVDDFYGMFVNDVAKGRGVKVSDITREDSSFGQGRVVTAGDAVKAKLADRVATFDETLSRMVRGDLPSTGRAPLAAAREGGFLEYEEHPLVELVPAEVTSTIEDDEHVELELETDEEPVVEGAERLLARAAFRKHFAPEPNPQ